MGIIITGAVVRLTGSGLGCPTWPRCSDESYVPHAAYGINGAIEFGNRLLTFVLIIVAVGAFVAAWRNRGRGSRLWWLTLAVGVGIPLQAIIGGITVLTQLNPSWVAPHLLLSVVLVVVCVWALSVGYGVAPTPVAPGARVLVVVTFAAALVSIVLGTVVTGAGPHAGDADAVRNGLDIETVARVHSLSAWLVVILTVACVWLFQRTGQRRPARAARLALLTVAFQGLVGYAQYFLGLPVGIVILHMVGLTALTAAVSWLLVSTTRRTHDNHPGASDASAVRAA